MLSKAEIKRIRSLQQKKYRTQNRAFVAEGSKIVLELIHSKLHIEGLYAQPGWMAQHPELEGIFHDDIHEVTAKEMGQISSLTTPQPVLVVLSIPVPEPNWEQLHTHLNLYLDDLRDPGNLGTLIRLADWFGLPQIFCSPDTVDAYNPKVVQGSMGSIARIPVYYIHPEELFTKAAGANIYAAHMEGENIFTAQAEPTGILAIGSESHGLSGAILQHASRLLTIPRKGEAESLNAALAAGILVAQMVKG